jgi:aspartate racemase
MLDRCGVDAVAMPCNTAHHWLDDLRRATTTPILSIVDAVAMDLRRRGINGGDIGILGTLGTVRSAIYARGWAGTGYRTINFDEGEIAVFVEPVIRAVKAGRIEEARPMMRCAVASLEARGVSAVVLGCTELPLAISGQESSAGTPLIDSTQALAAACVAWAEAFDASLVQSPQPLRTAA